MTKKQRVSLWRRMSKCFHHHEMTMIEKSKEEMKKRKSRIDIIGQNGNDGEHYDQMPDGRWNWYGEAEEKVYHKVDGRHPEPDATGMDDELPSAAEDCARVKGNYEL